ncbi:hypothetical protein GCM10027572_01550 [Flexivirga lutea]
MRIFCPAIRPCLSLAVLQLLTRSVRCETRPRSPTPALGCVACAPQHDADFSGVVGRAKPVISHLWLALPDLTRTVCLLADWALSGRQFGVSPGPDRSGSIGDTRDHCASSNLNSLPETRMDAKSTMVTSATDPRAPPTCTTLNHRYLCT